jgi:hypothetical protein
MVERQERQSWYHIVIINESQLYLNPYHEFIWLQPGRENPEREPFSVQSEKVTLTIIWNPNGCHLSNVRLKGFKFNVTDYLTQIFASGSDWHRNHVGRTNRKLTLHAKNRCPHIAKVTAQF